MTLPSQKMPFSISEKPIDAQALRKALQADVAGAYTAFEGWVRDHNEGLAVISLEYSSFQSLAEKEGRRIIQEALEQFEIEAAACVHRIGPLQIGDLAVWVGVSSRHRGPAFDACRYIIDQTKARVPIWKRENYRDGHSGWVNCHKNSVV